jgi:hypothetical protein
MVTNVRAEDLRQKSNEELAEFMAGWKQDTGNYILCEMEFKRRQSRGNEMRGWISLGISATALIVAVTALAVKQCA